MAVRGHKCFTNTACFFIVFNHIRREFIRSLCCFLRVCESRDYVVKGYSFIFDFCREWTESGQLWVQQVSSTPATRLDVVNLQEELDRRLQQRQARETGICPVRRELYSQCFGNDIICNRYFCSEKME